MIELQQITKTYRNETVLHGVNMTIQDGDFIAIRGKSGSGKTTLLNMIGLLEKPTQGRIVWEGETNLTPKRILQLQRHKIGYLFQNYALIDNESVEQNLKVALVYSGIAKRDYTSHMKAALERVGLNVELKKKIFQLSGGEQQRVALARMLLKKPAYIFADEPTGNLDIVNRDIVFDTIEQLHREGKTIVYVTHDEYLAQKANRTITL